MYLLAKAQVIWPFTETHFSIQSASGASGERLGWVDLDLVSSPGWWAASVATYCPSRMVEHPKSNSTQPSRSPDAPDYRFFRATLQDDDVNAFAAAALDMGHGISLATHH